MANDFYNRGASFNPDELADGDAIEAEFDAVSRGFDTIEDLVNANKAGYQTQTFQVATATSGTHAVPKAQMDTALGLKLDAVNYNASDILTKLKTVDGTGSGLDADLLDGQDSTYYRNASNINAGTLAKERLPASIDASTTGNAATATKTTATAAAGATADLVNGAMGGNDFFRIRLGGNTDAGWTEIATANNGDEPIYIRQYTGDFVTVARELKLLDAAGDSTFPGGINALVGGVTVRGNDCGIYSGNGDDCTSTVNNLKLTSWFGIGFGPSISGLAVPYGEYSHWFNTRNGDMGVRGTITAPKLNGNASTATRLATTRKINGVNFDGTANITVADDTKLPLTGGNLSGPITFTPGSGNVLNFGDTPVIRRFTGANSMSMGVGGDDTLLLGAGESVGIMATNMTLGGEDVHIGADTNIYMHVSTDNWATWTGRKTFSIDAVNGPLWAGGKVWNAGNDGSGSGLDADLLDGLHASSFLRLDLASTALYAITLAGGVSTAGKDVYIGNGAIITNDADGDFSARGGSNIDHIWHDDSTNTWHFCSDTTYKSTGNAIVKAATFSGNASTATKLQTAMTIALSGDVTGSVAFDGSANATITAALSDAGVLTSCAAAAAGGVGSYVFARCLSGVYTLGATIAGSSLNPVSYSLGASKWVYSTTALSGTWRFMSGNTSGSDSWVGIWLRIS